MGAIRLDHVWKYFGKESIPAVADLSLEVRDREFLVLVGPSGCGKTTSLRMVAGLDRPSYGRIWFGDEDVTDVPAGRRDVGMVFQSYALYPNMTVAQNLAFGPEVRHDPKRDIKRRVNEVADVLEIGQLLARRPSELSGGQRQRVALGRAIIRHPRLFLMDEPLSNLDAALRVQMRSELIRLHHRLEVTTVYVTHDQVEALTMGDRVAVLQSGHLHQIDTPTALYENPADLFVATFIGSPRMNVAEGTLRSDGGTATVTCFGTEFELAGRRAHVKSTGQKVFVGIRPTDMREGASAVPSDVRIVGVVDVWEHTGTEVFATIQAGQNRVIARLEGRKAPQPNEPIEVAFSPADIYLFDGETRLTLLIRSPA
jgi:multiple sugar transport system ATP-binding protein